MLLFLSFLLVASLWGVTRIRSRNESYLVVIGGIMMGDGLGRQAVDLVEATKDLMNVKLVATGRDKTDYPKWLKKITKKSKNSLGKVVVCQEPLDVSVAKLEKMPFQSGQIRIAYSMIESSLLSSPRVNRINEHFDAVVVPDPFLVEVYETSGIKTPIFTVPLGRDYTSFLNKPLKKNRGDPFIFGCLGSITIRKNPDQLIRAFHKAFANRSDVRLIMNGRWTMPSYYRDLHALIQTLGASNIQLTNAKLNNKEYEELFETFDCYVNVSKGEGFSIQPREAMARGIPVLLTDNTGQHTICESGFVKAIPTPEKEPASYPEVGEKGDFGYFSYCKDEVLADALLDMVQNYESHLHKTPQARQWVSSYTKEALNPLYISLVRPKKVILGTENKITPDYLMTNSEELFKKYKNLQ